MRGSLAQAVIAFGLLLRIKLKQVKSKVAVRTGHHKRCCPSCTLRPFKTLDLMCTLMGTLVKGQVENTM